MHAGLALWSRAPRSRRSPRQPMFKTLIEGDGLFGVSAPVRHMMNTLKLNGHQRLLNLQHAAGQLVALNRLEQRLEVPS